MQKSYDCITIGVSGGSIQLLFVVFPTHRLSAHKSGSLLFGRMPSSPLQGTDLLGLSPVSQPSPFQQTDNSFSTRTHGSRTTLWATTVTGLIGGAHTFIVSTSGTPGVSLAAYQRKYIDIQRCAGRLLCGRTIDIGGHC